MNSNFSQQSKDDLLRSLLPLLANRGMARKWATSAEPYSDLARECLTLANYTLTREAFRSYLQANPIIQTTVGMLLSHMAMAASVRWQDTPLQVQPLAKRGWHINRWLPTFLVIDGPLGRFLKAPDSPLNALLRKEHTSYPTLAQARDAFNHEIFRLVRNGVGHWSFEWLEDGNTPHISMIDWESGQSTVTVTLLEAEALHIVSFAVIEALDMGIFSRVNPKGG